MTWDIWLDMKKKDIYEAFRNIKIKYISILSLLFLCIFNLSTCASVHYQGIRYFIGKSESDLIKHFGYNGTEIEANSEEYDKVLYFTNRTLRYQIFKTNTVRYKVSRSSVVYNYSYLEYNDGCLLDNFSAKHFTSAVFFSGRYGLELTSPVRHSNNDAIVRSNINNYNNEIRRLRCIAPEYLQEQFNKTNIGDWFFVGKITQQYGSTNFRDNYNRMQTDQYVVYTLLINRIDVLADDRSETERHIVLTLNERLNQFKNMNGVILSEEQANLIIKNYRNDGYNVNFIPEGHSLHAFIKDGIVIKVIDPMGFPF